MASPTSSKLPRQGVKTGSKLCCNWLTSIWNLVPQPIPSAIYKTAMWPVFFSAKYSLNKQTLTVVRGFSENWHVKNGIYLGNKVTSPSVLLRDVAPPLCALLRRATWALNWHSELFEISTVVQHSTPKIIKFRMTILSKPLAVVMDDYRLFSSTVPVDA